MKDYEKGEVRVAVRHNGQKMQISWDGIEGSVQGLMQ